MNGVVLLIGLVVVSAGAVLWMLARAPRQYEPRKRKP